MPTRPVSQGHERRNRRWLVPKALAALLVGALAYSTLVETRMVRITRHKVPIRGLPQAFHGFTIVQLSDLHIGVWTRPAGVKKLVRQVNALHPDLIVLTGDYVNRFSTNCEPAGRALAGLKARHGVYAVLGNHDYWVDAESMTKALQESGIDVLFDEKRRISVGEDGIWLVGADDAWEGSPDYDRALSGVSARDVCVMLAHNPDAVLELEGRPVDLLLSGHTHGGQVHIPGIGPVYGFAKLGRKHLAGMSTFGRTKLYVSRGVGFITPVRFRCPPEIPVFTLRAER